MKTETKPEVVRYPEPKPDPNAKPLRATEQWALDYLKTLPLEGRTQDAVAEHFNWSPDSVKETFDRLRYWRLIK